MRCGGQGRAGQGRAGEGRGGQGRAGKGRAGQVIFADIQQKFTKIIFDSVAVW